MAGFTDTSKRIAIRNENFMDTGSSASKVSNKFAVQLRKGKRMNLINKKRYVSLEQNMNFPVDLFKTYPALVHCQTTSSTFASLCNILLSRIQNQDNTLPQLLVGIQSLLISESHSLLHINLSQDHIKTFISLLSNSSEIISQMSYDIIINILYLQDIYSETFINLGCLKCIFHTAKTGSDNMKVCSLWLLANLAGSSQLLRTKLINYGCLDFLIQYAYMENLKASVMDTAFWALCNFSKDLKGLKDDFVDKIMFILKNYLKKQDKSLKNTVLLILYNLIYNDEGVIKNAMKTEILQYLVAYAQDGDDKSAYLSLKILANILSSDDSSNTDKLMDLNIIRVLSELMYHKNSKIRVEVYICLANIAAGTKPQRQTFLQDFALTKSPNGLTDSNAKVQEESSYLFYNLSHLCTTKETIELFHTGIILKVSKALKLNTSYVFINTILESLNNFLSKLPTDLIEKLNEEGFFNPIQELALSHRNGEKAQEIMKKFELDKNAFMDQPVSFDFS